MKRCLQLAELAAGNTAPNPMVGAVLVHKDMIIGEGYHEQYGAAHAEVNCINSVSDENKKFISDSTLYVSLEPCAHYGKTPPCADLIIANKIKKVVVGCADPFAAVNGKGIAKMKAAGIEVTQNISEDDCKELNKRFFIFHGQQRPYIILKWAQTADGFIAGAGKATIISNELSNRLVHKWRGEEAAIMIGTNTARIDDPSLTTRLWKGKNPVRIVVDMDLQLPSSLQLFTDGGKTILLNKIKESQAHDTSYIKIGSSDVVQETCRVLHRASIQSVLIEGGALLLQTFIDAGLWDEARVIRSSMNIKNGLTAPILTNFHLQNEIHLLTDTISFYKNEITK